MLDSIGALIALATLVGLIWWALRGRGTAPALVQPPTGSTAARPKMPSRAERRTYVLSGTVPCANFTSDYDAYPVAVSVTDPEHYDALVASWVANRQERCQTVYLRPDPANPAGVLVQRSPATTIGCLSPTDAPLYRGLIAAIADRGLASTASAKTLGGTGSRQRLRLALSLDSPQRIATDFEIPHDEIIWRGPVETVTPIATPRRAKASRPLNQRLPPDHPRLVGVVGESHYQDTLRQMLARGTRARVTVEAEPTNPHDENAVRVANGGGETVGYLAKGQYTQLKQIARAQPVTCWADLRGGTRDTPILGIVLDLGDLVGDGAAPDA